MVVGAPLESRIVLAGLVLGAALGSLTRPLSGAAAVAVAVPVVAVLSLAVLGRPSPTTGAADPGVRRTAVLWAAVVALGVVWELAAWLQQPAYDVAAHEHPTVSVLLDPVTEPWLPRFAAWCCWLYVGYRLVRR